MLYAKSLGVKESISTLYLTANNYITKGNEESLIEFTKTLKEVNILYDGYQVEDTIVDLIYEGLEVPRYKERSARLFKIWIDSTRYLKYLNLKQFIFTFVTFNDIYNNLKDLEPLRKDLKASFKDDFIEKCLSLFKGIVLSDFSIA